MMFVLFFCFLLLIQFLLSKIGKQKKKKKGAGIEFECFKGSSIYFPSPLFLISGLKSRLFITLFFSVYNIVAVQCCIRGGKV